MLGFYKNALVVALLVASVSAGVLRKFFEFVLFRFVSCDYVKRSLRFCTRVGGNVGKRWLNGVEG